VQLELLDPYSASAEQIWRDLDAVDPRSYFLSSGWVENWLACLPREVAPRLAVIRTADAPVSAFFLARRTIGRLGVIGSSRALYFNTTGVPQYDELWIEHNGLVGRELSVGRLVDILPDDWDELFLPGMRATAFGGMVESVVRGFRVRIERTVPLRFVDLARARESGYLSLLGAQTRAQIRRAQRDAGSIEVDVADDERSALTFFDQLVALHQAHWRSQGQPGVFADPWFERFHRRLITRRFRHGEIQLLRMRTAHGPTAMLYNFVHDGRVLQYQSGVERSENRHLKAGYLAHTAAIEHAAAHGLAIYDFLGGAMRYKESLATDSTSLVWARLQRQRIRFMVEDRLRTWAKARRRPSEPAPS
jgi:CelD/BcsL family acetyltransferase involved in cellulose biosynthesis